MISIYLRHGKKKYKNKDKNIKKFKFDPPIFPLTPSDLHSLVTNLKLLSGLPHYIICSPYCRTRETAISIQSYLSYTYNHTVDIYCDNTLSEYLGNHPHAHLDVDSDTALHFPPHPETFEQFTTRIKQHLQSYDVTQSAVIWFITHGIVIQQIAHQKNLSPKPFIHELSGLILTPQTISYLPQHL